MFKKKIFILVIVFISLTACTLILEITARMIERRQIQKDIERDPLSYVNTKLIFQKARNYDLGFELQRNIDVTLRSATADYFINVVTNTQGLRESVDIPFQKPQGIKRIIGLGDSVMFGSAVNNDETMLKAIERAARGKAGAESKTDIQTINFGVPDSNPGYAYYNYKNKNGSDYNPDILLYGFCLNDFLVDCPRFDPKTGASIARPCRDINRSFIRDAKDFLKSNFALIRVGILPLRSSFRQYMIKERSVEPQEKEERSEDQKPSHCGNNYGCEPGFCHFGIDRTRPWFKYLLDLAKEKQERFVMVVFPIRKQLECLLNEVDVPLHQQKAALNLCDELGMTCYDVTLDLLKVAKEKGLNAQNIFWDAIHPTQEGNEIIGQLIFEFLSKNNYFE